MKRVISLLLVFLLCSVAQAQDTYDVFGDPLCDTVIDVSGLGNLVPAYVEISQDDMPLVGFYVPDGAQESYRLYPGAVSYRVSVTMQGEDEGRYSFNVRQECPVYTPDPELSDEDLIKSLRAQLSPYAPAFMDRAYFEHIIDHYGRAEAQRRVEEMNEIIAAFLASEPTQPPDTIPSADDMATMWAEVTAYAPTPIPTQGATATPQS